MGEVFFGVEVESCEVFYDSGLCSSNPKPLNPKPLKLLSPHTLNS